jgi:tetratricopeptide (TPR) repeat protein
MKSRSVQGNASGRSLFILSCLFFSSCAIAPSVPPLQPNINSLVVANRMNLAADTIAAQNADYGPGNYLLYYLDRGLVGFYAGRYQDSIRSFEKAKQRFAELYTTSLSKEGMTWLMNDNAAPYRGSDYEYVLVNVFQALNFLQLGDLNEALVEARDLTSKYQVVEGLAQKAQRRHFEDNGFARFFMGLILQVVGGAENESEALLFYKEARTLYQQFYAGTYVPRILQENLLVLSQKFDDEEYPVLRNEMRGVEAVTARSDQAQLIVIHLVGYSPLKVPEIIPVPLDRELITKITFPKFLRRFYSVCSARIMAENDRGWRTTSETELGSDIEDLAIKDLNSRKAIVLAKAVIRPALKYLIERKQKEDIEKRNGRLAAEGFGLLSNLYNLFSEQADLRSWQALPAQIRVARLFLSPGHYKLSSEGLGEDGRTVGVDSIGEVELRSGETRFIIIRSPR